MRFMTCLLCAVVGGVPVVAQQRAPFDGHPRVQVGVFSVQPDGSVGASASDGGGSANDQFTGAVLTDDCRVGAGSYTADTIPPWGRDAWIFRGRVLSVAPEQATIQLEWQRVRSAGAPVQSPIDSRQVTVPIDQLLTLESIGPAPPDSRCASSTKVFGVRYAPFLVPRTAGSGIGTAQAGAGEAVGSIPAAQFDAELWLIRSVPGQPENVVPVTARVANASANFDFGSVQAPVVGGVVDVRVTGQLKIVRVSGPQVSLVFLANSEAIFTPSTRPPRDRVTSPTKAQASVIRQLHAPDDVLEFVLPPLEVPGAPKMPDEFSVRVRLRPIKNPQ